jgi:histidine triad (HIT) family protein
VGTCIFCELHSGRASGRIVYRDESSIAFFPLKLGVRGHVIVAPLRHVTTWPELDADLVTGIFTATQHVSNRLCSCLHATGVNVLFASGSDAQQSVPHFHVHILPRWKADGVDAWPNLPGYSGDLDADLRALLSPVHGP